VARASAADLRAGEQVVQAGAEARLVQGRGGKVALAVKVRLALKALKARREALVAPPVLEVGAAAISRWRARANPRF